MEFVILEDSVPRRWIRWPKAHVVRNPKRTGPRYLFVIGSSCTRVERNCRKVGLRRNGGWVLVATARRATPGEIKRLHHEERRKARAAHRSAARQKRSP